MITTHKTLKLGGSDITFEVVFYEGTVKCFILQDIVKAMSEKFSTVFLCDTALPEYQAFTPILKESGVLYRSAIWRSEAMLSFDNLLLLVEILGFPEGFSETTKNQFLDDFKKLVFEEELQNAILLDMFTPETLRFRANGKHKRRVHERFLLLSEKYYEKLSKSDFSAYGTPGPFFFLGKL